MFQRSLFMENNIEYSDYIEFSFGNYVALYSDLTEPQYNNNSFLDYDIIKEKGLYDEPIQKIYQSYRRD